MLSKRAANCVLCSALHSADRVSACSLKQQVPAAGGLRRTAHRTALAAGSPAVIFGRAISSRPRSR